MILLFFKESVVNIKFKSFMVALTLCVGWVYSGVVWAQGQTKLHWYGQAAFKIETPNGGVILIDPWLTVDRKSTRLNSSH